MKRIRIVLALILMMFVASSHAALNFYAAFTLDGVPLDGDVTLSTIGGIDVSSDHIEAYQLDQAMLTGKRGLAQSKELVLMKRMDQTTPQIISGMVSDQSLDGEIKIFDNNLDSGETRHRFTIRLTDARIVGLETKIPDAFDPAEANRPPYEMVRIEVNTYEFIDEVNGPSVVVDF